MVSFKENVSRVKDFFRFTKQELSSLIVAILVASFIFSFRDWGDEQFSVSIGLSNLFLMFIAVGLSIFFRIGCQKTYALSQGYEAQFKVWWLGLLIMVIISFLSFGLVPLVLVGTMVVSFMVKQRLGEFRYGFSYGENAVISLWGIMGNMIAAIFFAVGLHFMPESYFFYKGMLFNLVMGFFALIPLPQLDGLQIFFGSKAFYFFGVGLVILAAIFLLSRTTIGLILAIIVGAGVGIVYLLKGSEV